MSHIPYSRLNNEAREIRILSLLPGVWADAIHCHSRAVSLDDNPDYEALSYVWGDPLVTSTVFFNGSPFQATANLFKALHRLRSKDNPRSIWVDALCINQDDIEERNHQVALMGEIYKRTSRVLIWLGDEEYPVERPSITWYDDQRDDELIERFFQTDTNDIAQVVQQGSDDVRDIHGALVFLRFLAQDMHFFDMPLFTPAGENKLDPTVHWEPAVRGMRLLVNSPWWDRIWIVQESVLPQEALVCFGNTTFPWSMIKQASLKFPLHLAACCTSRFNILPRVEQMVAINVTLKVNSFGNLRDAIAKGVSLSLYQLMTMTSQRLCTDIRDAIFALLPMVSDYWFDLTPFRPDYSLNVTQVYTTAIYHHLTGNGSLQILQGVPKKLYPAYHHGSLTPPLVFTPICNEPELTLRSDSERR
jgi:hypothetical protein